MDEKSLNIPERADSDPLRERFVGRQPIFDHRQQLFGYELLFRPGDVDAAGPVDGDFATDDVFDCMMNVMGFDPLTGGHLAFVNITRRHLLERRYEMLPSKGVVLELLEDVRADPLVIEACRDLKEAGYTLALDDLVSTSGMEPLLELADIVKVDFVLANPKQCHDAIKQLASPGCMCLAEKVENHDEFRQALDWGYDYFQGYFFQKPDVLREMELRPTAERGFRLLAAVSKPDIDFGEVEEIMKGDVGLSTRFLRYLNSSSFSFRTHIESLHHAVIMLGETAMRRWVTMLSLQQLSKGKPSQLMVSSLVRARMCEMLAEVLESDRRQIDLYLLGLLSLMDTMLSCSLDGILSRLTVAEDVHNALVNESGPLRGIHLTVSAYEQNRVDEALQYAAQLGIDARQLHYAYSEATRWADEIFGM